MRCLSVALMTSSPFRGVSGPGIEASATRAVIGSSHLITSLNPLILFHYHLCARLQPGSLRSLGASCGMFEWRLTCADRRGGTVLWTRAPVPAGQSGACLTCRLAPRAYPHPLPICSATLCLGNGDLRSRAKGSPLL